MSLIVYVTTGTCALGLDRRLVSRLNRRWYWLDLMVWRRLQRRPQIDLDFTQRWFAYSATTMIRAREELRSAR